VKIILIRHMALLEVDGWLLLVDPKTGLPTAA
jgi:hypothetical protein